jgi:hypothetical protein
MKNYSCKIFTNLDGLLKWLNKEQEYINVVSINYIDNSFHYEVIFYTEDNISGDDVEYTIKL